MGAIWLVESILNTDANGKKHVLKLSKSTGAGCWLSEEFVSGGAVNPARNFRLHDLCLSSSPFPIRLAEMA